MSFTLTDKTLLMRAGRLLAEQAHVLKADHGLAGWGGSAESKEAKRQHDRLLRDERDLRELAKRLEKQEKQLVDMRRAEDMPLTANTPGNAAI